MPTTYYWRGGPMGQAIQSVRAKAEGLHDIAVIGLGAGALACHIKPGEAIHFFEIDPTIVKIARDPHRFRFLSECAPDATITVGDARLTLGGDKGSYGIIIVDAFSSDAIPVHLMTREALALYLSRLTPHGVTALHISNNAMEFSGVIARAAADLGLQVYVKRDLAIGADDPEMRAASVVALLARDPSDLGPLVQRDAGWIRQAPDMARRPWTDDYSTILTALAAKQFGVR
jgi:spermidine synthase